MAVQAVTVNRLRAMLSLLGITIGIFAIIAVFTIVDSLEANIRETVSSLGSDILYLEKMPWAPEEGEEYAWWKYINRPAATLDESEYLRDKCRTAEEVCFVSSVGRRIEYRNNSMDGAYLLGVSEGFQEIRAFELERGRFFSPLEANGGRNVTVIGKNIAGQLFRGANPVGKNVEMMGRKVQVIGVIVKEGKGSFDGFILDDVALLPIAFYSNFIDIRSDMSNPQIWVKAKRNVGMAQLSDDVTRLMRSYRRLKPADENNFALNRTSIITNQLDQLFAVLKIAGFFIGIFSIIVGGFGIANIMFVSVKERTHIIGIQKALGAKKYFILAQFLFESVMLSVAGGVIGLLIIFMGAMVINLTSDFTVYLTMNNILLGIGISSLIGLISGIFPAWQGARMDPVVAINTTF